MKKELMVFSCFFASLLTSNVYAIPIAVDIITVVDESGSMSGEHAWIDDAILSLNSQLVTTAAGDSLTANYGLVGYGGSNGGLPVSYDVDGGQFGSAAGFATSAQNNLNASGGFEDGYEAMDFAFDYTFTPGSATNIILISDEDRDIRSGSTIDLANMQAQFSSSNTLLNAVVDCTFVDGNNNQALGIDSDGNAYLADGNGGFTIAGGGQQSGSCAGNTNIDYVNLALGTGGAAWDLNLLRTGGLMANSFTNAFVDIKVEEIVGQQTPGPVGTVPEPASLALIGFGLLGLRWQQRKVCS